VVSSQSGPEPRQLMEHTSERSRGSLPKCLLLPFLVIAGLLAAPQSSAQVTDITFTPSSPTANDIIVARVRFLALSCGFRPVTTVNGSSVRTTIEVRGCLIGPPGLFPSSVVTQFGPLAAGTYTYEVYFQYESAPPEFATQRPLVVAPAPPPPVPTMDFMMLAALALFVSGAGLSLARSQAVVPPDCDLACSLRRAKATASLTAWHRRGETG